MKNKIINFLIWALCKLDKTKLESLKVEPKEIKLKISKLVPDDGQWHEIGATIICCVKKNEDGTTLLDDLSVWNKKLLKSERDSLIVYWNLNETNDRTP